MGTSYSTAVLHLAAAHLFFFLDILHIQFQHFNFFFLQFFVRAIWKLRCNKNQKLRWMEQEGREMYPQSSLFSTIISIHSVHFCHTEKGEQQQQQIMKILFMSFEIGCRDYGIAMITSTFVCRDSYTPHGSSNTLILNTIIILFHQRYIASNIKIGLQLFPWAVIWISIVE